MRKLESEIDTSNERLSEFLNYVERNSDGPNAERTLTLIFEFEREAKDDEKEAELRVGRSLPNTIDVARQRRFNYWFGRLRQFQEWLRSKGKDHDAVLALRWIAEFEHKLIEEWLKEYVQAFLGDPPDNEFLHGFLSALLLINEEALACRWNRFHSRERARLTSDNYARSGF